MHPFDRAIKQRRLLTESKSFETRSLSLERLEDRYPFAISEEGLALPILGKDSSESGWSEATTEIQITSSEPIGDSFESLPTQDAHDGIESEPSSAPSFEVILGSLQELLSETDYSVVVIDFDSSQLVDQGTLSGEAKSLPTRFARNPLGHPRAQLLIRAFQPLAEDFDQISFNVVEPADSNDPSLPLATRLHVRIGSDPGSTSGPSMMVRITLELRRTENGLEVIESTRDRFVVDPNKNVPVVEPGSNGLSGSFEDIDRMDPLLAEDLTNVSEGMEGPDSSVRSIDPSRSLPSPTAGIELLPNGFASNRGFRTVKEPFESNQPNLPPIDLAPLFGERETVGEGWDPFAIDHAQENSSWNLRNEILSLLANVISQMTPSLSHPLEESPTSVPLSVEPQKEIQGSQNQESRSIHPSTATKPKDGEAPSLTAKSLELATSDVVFATFVSSEKVQEEARNQPVPVDVAVAPSAPLLASRESIDKASFDRKGSTLEERSWLKSLGAYDHWRLGALVAIIAAGTSWYRNNKKGPIRSKNTAGELE